MHMKNGCPWGENTCSNAAENGHIECLKYAHENGCRPCYHDKEYEYIIAQLEDKD